MKFERSELGALFSKLRTAVPEVRAVGTDDAGILLSGSNAYATNLELSVRAGLSKPVEQDVVVPPRGVDFISGTVAPEISIEADKGILTVKSGTARARLNTTPAENYPEFSGPGNDAKRCIVGANDLSWAISKVLYAVSKDDKHPAHRGLCFSRKGEDVLEICALDGYRMAIARINCTADGDFRFTLPAATAKAVDTLSMDGSVEIVRDRKKAVFSDSNFEVKSRLIAEHYTILWAYATLREKLKWYEDAGIPAIPDYGLNTIRRAINRYGTAPQLQMAIKEMSELTKAICNLQRAVTFNYRNGAKIKVAHESVREEIADVYIMLAQLVEIVGKPEEVQQIVLEKLEQLKGDLDGGEVQSE